MTISNELKKRGIFISPGGMRSVWLRNGLTLFRPFQGQYEDEETGLYYNQFRHYDPEGGST